MTNKLDLEVIDALLSAYGVNLMLYDSLQDADWIQRFSTDPGWELASHDQETVLFRRVGCVFPDDRSAYVHPPNPLKT
jgi:hypothetical protein